jgi:2-dehydro-3-deoxygalactonokinase
MLITLDTGTTNTRALLWHSGKVIAKASRPIGVRDTAIDGNNQRLKAAVKEAIEQILFEKSVQLGDVAIIVASGMITSNVGLVEIPHLTAPVGLEELANGMVKKHIPDVVDKEIWFIPGVKNKIQEVTIDNCEAMDIMRGEEAEIIGLIDRLNINGPAVIVLPGSHSKFVSINEENRITGCLTSLAGELISVVTNHTIIANALNKSFADEFNREYVIKGYRNSNRVGLNRMCFSIRILDQFTNLSVNDKANFLLGIVLSDDLKALKNSSALTVNSDSRVIIAGKDILRDAFEAIMNEDSYFDSIQVADSDTLQDLAGHGAVCIALKHGL